MNKNIKTILFVVGAIIALALGYWYLGSRVASADTFIQPTVYIDQADIVGATDATVTGHVHVNPSTDSALVYFVAQPVDGSAYPVDSNKTEVISQYDQNITFSGRFYGLRPNTNYRYYAKADFRGQNVVSAVGYFTTKNDNTGSGYYEYWSCRGQSCSYSGLTTYENCVLQYGAGNCFRQDPNCASTCITNPYPWPWPTSTYPTDWNTTKDYFGCSGTNCKWLGYMTGAKCYELNGGNCYTNMSCDGKCTGGTTTPTSTPGSTGGLQKDYFSCAGNACKWVGYMSDTKCQEIYGTNCYTTLNCNGACSNGSTDPGTGNTTTTTEFSKDYFTCSGNTCKWAGYMTLAKCQNTYGTCFATANCNNTCASADNGSGTGTGTGTGETPALSQDYFTCSGNTCKWAGYMTAAKCQSIYGANCYTSANCNGACSTGSTGNTTSTTPGNTELAKDQYTCSGNACKWAGYMTGTKCAATYGACFDTPNCNNTCAGTTGTGSTDTANDNLLAKDFYGCNGANCKWLGYMTAAKCQSLYGANCSDKSNCNNACSAVAGDNTSNTGADNTLQRDFYGCNGNTCKWLGYMTAAKCQSLYGANCYANASCDNKCGNTTGTGTTTGDATLKSDFYTCQGNTCKWAGYMTEAKCFETYGQANCSRNSFCDNKCGSSTDNGNTTGNSTVKSDFYTCQGNTCKWAGYMTEAKCFETYGQANCSKNAFCDNKCGNGNTDPGTGNTTVKQDFYGCNNNTCKWLGYMTEAKCFETYGQANCSKNAFCDNKCGNGNTTTTTGDTSVKADFYGCVNNACKWLGYMTEDKCFTTYGSANCSKNSFCDNKCGSVNGTSTTPADNILKRDYYGCNGNACRWLGYMTADKCYSTYGQANCSLNTFCDNKCGNGNTDPGTTPTDSIKYDFYGCQGNSCKWLGYMAAEKCYTMYGQANCSRNSFCDNKCGNGNTDPGTNPVDNTTKYDFYGCVNNSCKWLGYMTAEKCYTMYGQSNCSRNSFCDNKCSNGNTTTTPPTDPTTKRDYYGCQGGSCKWLGYMTAEKCYTMYGSANCSLNTFCDNKCGGNDTTPTTTPTSSLPRDFYGCVNDSCKWLGYMTYDKCYTMFGQANCYTATNCENKCGSTNNIVKPSCDTLAATDIGKNQATLNGYLSNLGNSNSIVLGFELYPQNQRTNYRYVASPNRSAVGNFAQSAPSEFINQSNTTYCYTAVCSNEAGVSYAASEKCFTPNNGSNSIVNPAVSTLYATDITMRTATLMGSVDSMGNDEYVVVYFEYGKSQTPSWTTVKRSIYSTQSFPIDVTDLEPNTTYYFRTVGRNQTNNLVYGSWKSFTTNGGSNGGNGYYTLPRVYNMEPRNVQYYSATLRGDLQDLGGYRYSWISNFLNTANAAQSVELWIDWGLTSSYGNRTASQYHDYLGEFSNDITGLQPDTIYHFRACARNSYGTYCDNDWTFRTPATGYYYGGNDSTERNMSMNLVVANLTTGTAYSDAVNAQPGDTLKFKVDITNNGWSTQRDIYLQNTLPYKLRYTGITSIDGIQSSDSIVNSNYIYIGNLSVNQTKTITFEAVVEGPQYFAYGTTVLTDFARVSNRNYSLTDYAKIYVANNSQVAGAYIGPNATYVSTGLTSKITDFIIFPFVLALLALFIFRKQFVFAVDAWDKNVQQARELKAGMELKRMISRFKQNH